MNKRTITKAALILSACLILVWAVLGTGASLAWFQDESPTLRNTFIFGEMKPLVSYKVDGVYVPVEEDTVLFNDEALYEPGYTQVVYLKIENAGSVPFDYKLSVAVDPTSVVYGTNALGGTIYLPNYLKFGAIFGKTEAQLDRQIAQAAATMSLNSYTSETGTLTVDDGADYVALIVAMPEEVGNVANYRGADIPKVELGVTVLASQSGKR